MTKFRKKPVVIEAIQWNSQENIEAIEQMLGDKLISEESNTGTSVGNWVKTLEGDMMISWGDWIIRGINGEFYPCKPDIFEKTYEKVEEAIAAHDAEVWKPYPENKPENVGYYMITTINEEVGIAYWDRKWWMEGPESGVQMGIKDDFIIAFCKRQSPYQPKQEGER